MPRWTFARRFLIDFFLFLRVGQIYGLGSLACRHYLAPLLALLALLGDRLVPWLPHPSRLLPVLPGVPCLILKLAQTSHLGPAEPQDAVAGREQSLLPVGLLLVSEGRPPLLRSPRTRTISCWRRRCTAPPSLALAAQIGRVRFCGLPFPTADRPQGRGQHCHSWPGEPANLRGLPGVGLRYVDLQLQCPGPPVLAASGGTRQRLPSHQLLPGSASGKGLSRGPGAGTGAQ